LNTTLADQLNWISDSMQLAAPELILASAMLLLIIASLFPKIPLDYARFVAIAAISIEIIALIAAWPSQPTSLFVGMMKTDEFSASMRLMFAAGGVFCLLMKRPDDTIEYILLIVTVVLGANLLVMSNHFVMIIISMELISISSYILTTGQNPTRIRAEAGWKFFIFGSAATAIMIFGMSYLYGLTGTLDISSTTFLQLASAGKSPIVVLAGMMTLGGFLFKMSAVPFHLWVPDVYESCPAPLVAFFSVVPKLAGLGATIKFSLALHLFGQSAVNWSLLVGAAAVVSIAVGSVAALSQKDAKRMMAWSSVAQSGFLLAGVSSVSLEGVRVTLFYGVIFLVMNFAAFVFIDAMEKTHGSTKMESLAGIGRTAPLPSILVCLALVSLTGLPPTAGFMAKLFLFSSVWEKYEATRDMLFLVLLVVGLAGTVISLFFYLRIPYFLFIKTPPSVDNPIKISTFQNLLSLILVVVLLLLFFAPGLLMGWLNKVNFVL
jgi:NADH-quinone oxidoreductase subunit N